MHIYKINDCDWMAAETLEDAIRGYMTMTGMGRDEAVDDPYELTGEELDTFQFHETDDNNRPLEIISFRVALARRLAEGWKAPFLFASTEQ